MANKKNTGKAVEAKKHNHDLPLQQKLKDKNWDPIKEIIEITDEYDEGTPKREGGKDYWGACCLESQDVDIAQKVRRPDEPASRADSAQKAKKKEHKHQ